MSKAIDDILAERQRQIEVKGWTPEHDDAHDAGDLAGAGAAYAINAACLLHPLAGDACLEPPPCWNFEPEAWKPNYGDNPRGDLVKAAALILAEIEKMDRAAQ